MSRCQDVIMSQSGEFSSEAHTLPVTEKWSKQLSHRGKNDD